MLEGKPLVLIASEAGRIVANASVYASKDSVKTLDSLGFAGTF